MQAVRLFPVHLEEEQQMSHPTVVLLVRFKSALPRQEAEKIMNERAPEFRALSGLQQKFYLEDAATGEYAGLYLWDSPQDLAAYRDSELRASIAKAYKALEEPRIEVYKVLMPLRDEVG
jgi:heme-degrading monooxygenase HmoA